MSNQTQTVRPLHSSANRIRVATYLLTMLVSGGLAVSAALVLLSGSPVLSIPQLLLIGFGAAGVALLGMLVAHVVIAVAESRGR